MSLLTQLANTIQYQFHKATFDPDAEKFAKEKAATDEKAAEEAAAKKKSEDELAKTKAEAKTAEKDVSGAICYGTPIALSPTKFFENSIFLEYIGKINKEGSNKYQFTTLDEAKAKCSTTPKCTGIWTIKSQGNSYFLVYTGDPTLVSTNKPDSPAYTTYAVFPDNKFIPVAPCVDPNDAGDEFSWTRLLGRVLSITVRIVILFLLIVAGLYGSSLATNLNLYREAPIRVLYAIYGFLFFWIVIPYSLLYRWWWKGKKPVFYAFIPLVPYKFNNRYAAMFLSWMSFKPDDQIACLMEWKK